MRIFISYPREFEKSADKIYWELQSRGFLDVFLDSETIHAGDTWKVVIERQIREASVFIILYDHGAAEDKSRYFCAELELIKEECKNIGKLIITVLFPPAMRENLPAYLDQRQVIASATNEIDPRSIDKVIGEVQRREAKRRRDIQSETRKQTLAFTMLIATILAVAGIAAFRLSSSGSMPPNPPLGNTTTREPVSGNTAGDDPWAVSKKTCEELLNGKQFDLWGSYTLIEEEKQGIRATSKAAKWKTINCEKIAEPEGTYILNGQEETTHEVLVKINDKYKYVADAKNKSLSELTINKAGMLVDRRISYPPDGEFHGKPKIDEVNTTENFWKEHRSYIREKLERYKEIVRQIHEKADKTMHCVPTRGRRKDNRELIAFTCVIDPSSFDYPKYTRVMMKQN